MRIGVDLGGTKIEVIALDPAAQRRARCGCDAPIGDRIAGDGGIT